MNKLFLFFMLVSVSLAAMDQNNQPLPRAAGFIFLPRPEDCDLRKLKEIDHCNAAQTNYEKNLLRSWGCDDNDLVARIYARETDEYNEKEDHHWARDGYKPLDDKSTLEDINQRGNIPSFPIFFPVSILRHRFQKSAVEVVINKKRVLLYPGSQMNRKGAAFYPKRDDLWNLAAKKYPFNLRNLLELPSNVKQISIQEFKQTLQQQHRDEHDHEIKPSADPVVQVPQQSLAPNNSLLKKTNLFGNHTILGASIFIGASAVAICAMKYFGINFFKLFNKKFSWQFLKIFKTR